MSEWPFSLADLTAGLRRYFSDTGARVVEYVEAPIAAWPSVGSVRGMAVRAETKAGERQLLLVVKEPKGATRAGLAGVGRREAGVYQSLRSLLPVDTPRLVAADPEGDWLIMDAVAVGTPPREWTPDAYRQSVVHLAQLHERFWGLADDLSNYPWLAKPLTADFEIHVFAAAQAVEKIVVEDRLSVLTDSRARLQALGSLISEAERVAAPLRALPQTLLHGDYWPGNMMAHPGRRFTLVDWQLAGIGPGVLDLVVLIKNSQWWFSPLPAPAEELVEIYRREVQERVGLVWSEDDWELLWDHAMLWRFMQEWLDLLAAMPPALAEARADLLKTVWLDPLQAAVSRRLREP